jgi:hypothetical protein
VTGWGWVVAGYLLTAGTWGGYLLWTRPGKGRQR